MAAAIKYIRVSVTEDSFAAIIRDAINKLDMDISNKTEL